MSRLFQSTLRSLLIAGILIDVLLVTLFVSAKSIPETESEPSDSSDSDADYSGSQQSSKLIAPIKTSNKRTPAAILSAPSVRRQWKCARKGEQCGKVGNEWKSCCRSFTACVGNDPTKMVCDH